MDEDAFQKFIQKLEGFHENIGATLPKSPTSGYPRRKSVPCKYKHVKNKNKWPFLNVKKYPLGNFSEVFFLN